MKKKVLLVMGVDFGMGGVQTVVMNTVRSMSSEYTFDIILLCDDQKYYEEEFTSYGGKIFRMPAITGKIAKKIDPYLRGFRIYRKTLEVLKKHGPYCAIHCHTHFESGISLAAAEKVGVRSRIAHIHLIHTPSHIISRIYNRFYQGLIEKHATHKLGCSQEACDSFYKTRKDVAVINNTYDQNNYYFGKYPEKEFLSPRLLQIGSFSENKNQIFSLDVLAEVKKEYPQAEMGFVGFDLGALKEMQAKIKKLGLEDNVVIYPSDADSARLLSESSATLFPSKKEGFGVVTIESQAMGVKCYASQSVPRLTDCGGCSYLSLDAGAKYWAEEIIADFKQTGGKHQKYDCSRFSGQCLAKQYSRIYNGESK